MRRKILAVILSIIFIFTQTSLVEAKARSYSSGSRSVTKSSGYSGSKSSSSSKSSGYSGSKSSSSSSKSSGYSGSSSSSSKSSGGSSSSGYSGSSSSRSVPGSSSSGSSSSSKSSGGSSSSSSSGNSSSSSKSSGYSGSSSSSGGSTTKSSSGGVKSKTDTMKSTYMQDVYKKQVSQSNYSAYKQKLNDEQKKTYESSFGKTYGNGSRLDFDNAMNTRTQRVSQYSTRPIRININTSYFGGPLSYGYAFAGPWDLWFLMRASDLFWYHHWSEIHPYRDNFDAVQFAEIEKRVQALEAQNIARDPSYLEPDVDPDLQLSSDYLEQNMDKYYYSNKYAKPVTNPFVTLVTIIIIILLLLAVLRSLSKRRPRKPYGSGGIY